MDRRPPWVRAEDLDFLTEVAAQRILIKPGGGTGKGTFNIGVTRALLEMTELGPWGAYSCIDAVIANSAGAPAGIVSWLTDPDIVEEVWINQIMQPRVTSKWGLVTGTRPAIDIDHIFNGIVAPIIRGEDFDETRLRDGPDLYVGVFDEFARRYGVHPVRCRTSLLRGLLSTTANQVLFTRRFRSPDMRYTDGGLPNPLPYAVAPAATTRIVVYNDREDFSTLRGGLPERIVVELYYRLGRIDRRTYQMAAARIPLQVAQYRELQGLIDEGCERTVLIVAPRALPEIFCTNKAQVRDAIEQGYDATMQQRERIVRALQW